MVVPVAAAAGGPLARTTAVQQQMHIEDICPLAAAMQLAGHEMGVEAVGAPE